jgi:hypothetical protein
MSSDLADRRADLQVLRALPRSRHRRTDATDKPVMRATSNSLRRLCSRSFATLSRSQFCEVFIFTQQGEISAGKDSFRRKLPQAIEE